MTGYDDPRREDGDENAWNERASIAPAWCEACAKRPGEIAVDGDWLCAICEAALETQERRRV